MDGMTRPIIIAAFASLFLLVFGAATYLYRSNEAPQNETATTLQCELSATTVESTALNPNGRRIPIIALGTSLSVLFAVTYVVCVASDLLFPALAMCQVWLPLLPEVTWLSWQSFSIGLVESVVSSLYGALIFGPTFNWPSGQTQQGQYR